MDEFNYRNFCSNLGIYLPLFEQSQNIWESLTKVEQFIQNFGENLPEGFTQIKEKVFVGQNVKIDELARIDGIAIISHNSTIGHAAYIRGGVLIGENVNIGHAVEIKHSIVLSGTAIAHLNYVGDSIIGDNANISGGAILANFRFDKQTIKIKKNGEIIETGLDKLGSVIGGNSQIGVNAVLNPGTVIGRNSIVFPLTSASGYYPQDSRIKS